MHTNKAITVAIAIGYVKAVFPHDDPLLVQILCTPPLTGHL